MHKTTFKTNWKQGSALANQIRSTPPVHIIISVGQRFSQAYNSYAHGHATWFMPSIYRFYILEENYWVVNIANAQGFWVKGLHSERVSLFFSLFNV